ncbi:hypothetical protein AB0E08_30055 [Streptomyces sp. NPDC048281]|uniref:VOC family protein n=1 Tax=Streptomyces sp. NPDC048281 TaxID=3154715 RepID=UPI003418B67D
MVKLYVGTLDAAERFCGRVFGAKFAVAQGENVHIVTFPDGGPGLVLIKKGPHDGKTKSGFIIQVPDPGSRSVDVLDPWGNQVEILQRG